MLVCSCMCVRFCSVLICLVESLFVCSRYRLVMVGLGWVCRLVVCCLSSRVSLCCSGMWYECVLWLSIIIL